MPSQNTEAPLSAQPCSETGFNPDLPDIFGDGGAWLSRMARTEANPRASAVAVEFLRSFDPNGRHNLVAIDPAGEAAIQGRTFEPGAWDFMAQWIDERDGRYNLYFSVNEPKARSPHKKLAKTDIGAIRAAFVDVDPAERPQGSLPAAHFKSERDRLRSKFDAISKEPCRPTVILDTGGGFQAFWYLDKKLPAEDALGDAEALNKSIGRVVDGDAVHNAERIMRLPGTLNIPKAAKRDKGQVERRACISHSTGPRWTFDQLAAAYPPSSTTPRADQDATAADAAVAAIAAAMKELDMDEVTAASSYDDLPEDLKSRFERCCRKKPSLRELWETGEPGERKDGKSPDRSGSGRRFALARELRGFSVNDYGALLWIWPQAVNVGDDLEEKVDARGIARAWGKTAPERAKMTVENLDDYGDAPPDQSALAVTGWPEPIDIFGDADPGELGQLPVGALPSMMARWAKSEARRKGAPEAFAAISIVTVFGAAIGAGIRLQVRQRDDGWTEAGNLWSVLVAPPGSAKSPIIDAAVAPLRSVNDQWLARDTARHAQWVAASKRRGKDAPPAGSEPRIRRTVVDDMTSEKAVRIFRDNPRGVLQAPDELAGLLGGFGAYKSGGGSDRAHFLRTFDGGSITVDRVGSGTTMAERAQVTVLAGTQPEKLRGLVRDLGTDGLLQRFIVVLHDGRERPQLDEEPDREAAAWLANSIERLTAAGDVKAEPVRLCSEAGQALDVAIGQIKVLKHIPGATDAFRGHLEKWGKILPRLVLIIHVARTMKTETGFDCGAAIEADTVNMAAELARFLLRHSLAFYSTYFGVSPAASEALWIAGFLLTRPELLTVSRKVIYDARKELRGPENLRALLAAMGELEAAGWCIVQERDSSGPKVWRVNPGVHSRFSDRAERERREREIKRAKIAEAGRAREWLNSDASSHFSAIEGIFG